MDLTNEQWQVIEPLIGEMPRRADERGRPGGAATRCSMASSGFCARAPSGLICPTDIPVPDLPPPLPALGA